jgi:hypothetical protein
MLAVPTRHLGIQYRSRTEAEWAAVFSAHDIRFEYERIAFFFGRVAPPKWLHVDAYLPDFWLPEYKLWVEVKPQVLNAIEFRKAALLTECTGSNVLVTCGAPDVIDTAVLVKNISDYQIISTVDGDGPFKLEIDLLGAAKRVSSGSGFQPLGEGFLMPERDRPKLVIFLLPGDDHSVPCFCKRRSPHCWSCGRFVRSFITEESVARLEAIKVTQPATAKLPAMTTRSRYLLGGYRP